jgi:cytochrome c-type biogenesis protein
MDFSTGTAFLGGLLTFASPCVLPLIPIYLSVLVGGSVDEVQGGRDRFKLLLNGSFFVLGFLAVFVLLGLTASALGKFMIQYRMLFQQLGGMMVFFFGLKFLGLVKLDVLDREKRFNLMGRGRIGPLGAALIGFTFAFGWTPCIGPVLGSILTFTAVSANSMGEGALLLLVYGLGLGLPLLAVAAFAQTGTRWLRVLTRYIPKIERATGVVLVVVAMLMVTDSLGTLTFSAGDESSARISKEMVVRVKRDPARPVVDFRPVAGNESALDGAQECSAESESCGLGEVPGTGFEGDMELSLDTLLTGPVVLDFFKPDCPACLRMVPVLRSLDDTCASKGLRIEKIDISDPINRRLAMEMGVMGTPTLLFYNDDSQEVARLVGAQPFEAVHQAISVLMGGTCAEFSRFES